MTLSLLQIEYLRNIQTATLSLHPHLNVIVGPNGSGKTSLLEAIYLLSSGYSFRTREISPLIQYDTDKLTVFARTQDQQTISIQKSKSTSTQVRINSVSCQKSSELAHLLPCLVLHQDLFQFIEAGPSVRRSFLDWGVFHVKHSYHFLWQQYRRALKQRNCLLRQNASPDLLIPWNEIMEVHANQLHELRLAYVSTLQQKFAEILPRLTDLPCSLKYEKGWDRRETSKTLSQLLQNSYHSDLQRQYTQYGPHQADLSVEIEDLKIKHHLSRGQQKMVLFSLRLAQLAILERPCLVLCDDLPSELDSHHLQRLMAYIANTDSQFFITAVSPSFIPALPDTCNLFSLSQGRVEFNS